jgi:phage-related protein
MRLRRVRREEWDVVATASDRGDCRLLDFLAGLEGALAKQRTRLLALLNRVAQSGPPRRTEQSHKISGEIWEFIEGDLRVLWFYDEGRVVVCTTGFVKKSRKTPESELSFAKGELARYFAAKARGALVMEEQGR